MWALRSNCSTRPTLKGWSVRGAYLGGWIDKRAGTLQPLSFTRGLARAAREAGVALHENSPVEFLEQDGEGWRIGTAERHRQGSLCRRWDGCLFDSSRRWTSRSNVACSERAGRDRAPLAKSPGAYFAGWPVLFRNPAACILFPALSRRSTDVRRSRCCRSIPRVPFSRRH